MNENASWHSDCYKKCTHKANMDRSERLYEERLPKPPTTDYEERPRSYTTRSTMPMYDKKKCMDNSGGAYVPLELVKGRFVFCAADNIDFLEDPPYGKGTLHGTVMVDYQEKEDSDAANSTKISRSSSHRSLQKGASVPV